MGLTRREAAFGTALLGLGAMGAGRAGVTSRPWGKLPDGRTVTLYSLSNRNGLTARIMDYGGVIVGLDAPDRAGRLGDVMLGFDRFDPYMTDSPGFGAVIGRYANRIAGGRFSLDGKTYQLALNAERVNNLHGGPMGWDKQLWRGRPLQGPGGPGLELTLVSPDGDQGFPGRVDVVWTYRLTDDNRLTMEARATTDAPTVINMTNHAYFNLSADPSTTILDHELQIDATSYTPKDRTAIPTGEIAPVAGTPLDFRTPKPIGQDIAGIPGGYDHNLVVNGAAGQLRRAARARDPKSGRTLEVWTDQPGVQFYSAHWLKIAGKGGVPLGAEHGFCLEPQHYPDSPNKPQFPSTVLRPGETFRWRSEFRFGVA